jgi:hypothetical protein
VLALLHVKQQATRMVPASYGGFRTSCSFCDLAAVDLAGWKNITVCEAHSEIQLLSEEIYRRHAQ